MKEDLSKTVADIFGLEHESGEWRLITYNDDVAPIEYVDYTNEVNELVALIEEKQRLARLYEIQKLDYMLESNGEDWINARDERTAVLRSEAQR